MTDSEKFAAMRHLLQELARKLKEGVVSADWAAGYIQALAESGYCRTGD